MPEFKNDNKFLGTFLSKTKSGITRPASSWLKAVFYFKKFILRMNNECIVIACMPKSGSTFLLKGLSNITGFEVVWPFINGAGRDAHNFYPPYLIDIYGKKTVCQMHMKATEANLKSVENFSLKPIILVRNLFDAVISIRDHLHKEGTRGPIVYINDEFFKLNYRLQIDFIIELVIPWYIDFYVSWFSACEDGLVDPLWLTYDELTTNTHSTLRFIMDSYNLKKSDEEIEETLAKVMLGNVRFNKGVSGRGYHELTDNQIQRIQNFTRFYPWVDFSKIGIDKNSLTGII
jgi:hypothetical protein